MNNICIITMSRIDEAETIARLLEEISANNEVRIIILTGLEGCLKGIEMASHVMACQQLVVVRKHDGTISTVCEKLVNLAAETETKIYYFD